MSKFDLIGLLKHENTQLLEELMNYRAEIANLWTKIQELETEQKALKKKFEKLYKKPPLRRSAKFYQ
jgi:predicted nuclease with TOPRIM domain